ncbi:hypothetical protein [Rhodovulum marinum]|uniref:Uncharacterized protein n=1 Tax=Rhodovulum marinum TaxID=320662 RepID=A0A4R2PQU8_9RHOB|nr:hypothetical protein [Rhodovulum marinum]TCP38077.1 hypothetical protein EV662_12221 [Rhodovulum marinum]
MRKIIARICAGLGLFLSGTFASAETVEGTWTGTYQCGQGITGVELTITSEGMALGRIGGTFRFYPEASNPDAPEGKFAFVGRISQDERSFTADLSHWIQRPPGIIARSFEAQLSGDGKRLVGRINHPTCSTLSVTKTAEPRANSPLAFLTPDTGEKSVAEACLNLDMSDAAAVYDCISLAGFTNASPFDRCESVTGKVLSAIREAYKAQGVISGTPYHFGGGQYNRPADAVLPSCEVVAKVVYDLAGQEPYWTPCLSYDPANKAEHFKDCVMAYLTGRENRDENGAVQFFQSAGCDQLKRIYFQLAMPDAYEGKLWPNGQILRLPENIEDIDCLEIAGIEF